jgi:hypothetical protein
MQNFQIKNQKMLKETLGEALVPTVLSYETKSAAQQKG